jgi:hypothetical protein
LKAKLPSENPVCCRIACLAALPIPPKKMEDLVAFMASPNILPKPKDKIS